MPPRAVAYWRVSSTIWHDFTELHAQLLEVGEESDEGYAILDRIQALPGHPRNTDGGFLIIPILTTVAVSQPRVTLN